MKKNIKAPKCVVVGFGIGGLGLVRTLTRSGVHVTAIIDSLSNYGIWSRFGKKIRCLETGEGALTECLISIGKAFDGDKAALILTADDHVLEVSKNKNILSEYFVINLPDNRGIETLIDKMLFAEYASANNLPVPKTYLVKNVPDVESLAKRIEYPCILKPHYRNSEWVNEEFPKVFKIANAEELTQTYKKTEPYNNKCIIQDWVEGGEDSIYFCLIYQPMGSGSPICFTGKKVRQWPNGTGSTSMAVPCKDPGIEKISLKIFKDFNIKGFGSVEYKMDVQTGRLLIIEPTVGRIDLQSGIIDAAGITISYYALCDMLGLTLPVLEKYPRHVNWLCEPYEIKNIWYLLLSGKFSIVAWLRTIKGRRRYALFAWDDPMPLAYFFYSFIKHRFLKLFSNKSPM